MKKKFSLSLILITLCTSIFIGGCSCGKNEEEKEPPKPVNPNANVILATDIQLSNSLITDAMVGTPITITYVINPNTTTDKTMIIESSDVSVATVDKTEVTGTLTDTITVTPVGVGTVNIIFTWNGLFDNDVESENRTLTKATKIHVVGEVGKETLSTPTGLNYSNGKLTWNKVSYGTDNVTAEPKYELTLTGGATPTAPITMDTNEYTDLVLTAGVEYTAKVKAKPTDDLQYFYTASAYSEPISIYKLPAVDSMEVENGVVTWDVIEKANKYIVNVNGVDVETIAPETNVTTVSFDTKSYFNADVTEVAVKVKAICDNNPLVFDSEYSLNNPTIYQIGTSQNFTLTKNADDTATISWDAVANASNYIIEIYEDGVADAIVTETLTSTSYTLDSSYTNTYKIRVKATGNTYTLPGEFSDYYEFSKQDIAKLNATLVDGVVEFNIAETNNCNVVFYAIDNTNTLKTKSFSTNSGTFDVSELTTSESYVIYARLDPQATSNMLVSDIVRVGYGSKITFSQNADHSAQITWDRLDSAVNYTVELTKGGSSVLTDTVENVESGEVTFNIPTTLAVGDYQIKVTINTDSAVLYAGESNVETFTKVDVESLQTSFADNVLSITTTDNNITKVLITVTGPSGETFEESLPATIDFSTKGCESGTYTVSIKALTDINSKYIVGETKEIADAIINVITNPTVQSVSASGLITWNTDATYTKYTVYVDKGTASEIVFPDLTVNTQQLYVTGLSNGPHKVCVVAEPATGYLPSQTYQEFAFTKLSTVSNIKYQGGKIVWDAVTDAGEYEVIFNGENKGNVTTPEYTPDASDIDDANIIRIRPLGNGTNSISAEEPSTQTIEKVRKVTDLGVINGQINWTEEDGVTYKMFVGDTEVPDGKTYKFAGLEPNTYAKVYVYAYKDGYFDSDISNIFYVKKLAKVTNIQVTSTDKVTYKVSYNKVTGAGSHIIVYNDTTYTALGSAGELTIIGDLAGGDYTVTVQAVSTGDATYTDGDKTWAYINGDVSDEHGFTKLHTPTTLAVSNGQLVWSDESTSVSYYELHYALNVEGDKIWHQETLTDAKLCDMSFITTAGSYLVKIKGVGSTGEVLTSDYSEELNIVKIPTVDNLKVSYGGITWDNIVSDGNAYVYDVYVYTIAEDGSEQIHGEIATNYANNTYTIPGIIPEEEYFIKIKAKNSIGTEIPSEYSTALKVIKLIAPLSFDVSNNVASWTQSTYADATYVLQFTKTGETPEVTYEYANAGVTSFNIPNDLATRVIYNLQIMAKGTVDSGDTMVGYLNSDYSTALELYKLAEIYNLRVEDGEVVWGPGHSLSDPYQPVDYFIVLYKDGDTVTSSREFTVTTLNQTTIDLGDIEAGNYMIEFHVRGNGANILSSNVTYLGDSDPIRKLATPSKLHMQNGVMVWQSTDNDMGITYVLYNNGVQFMEKDASNMSFYPEGSPAGTEYYISVQAKMEGALYSGESEVINVQKLANVTGFTLDQGFFKWNSVENATGYLIKVSYMDTVYEEDGETPKVDEETGETLQQKVTMDIPVLGGATIEYAIIEQMVSVEYSIDSITAIGNTTSSIATKGYFTSNPTALTESFTPLSAVTGLTVRNGEFVWDPVTGAGYYTIQILNESGTVVKTDTSASTSYRVADDVAVTSGKYTIKVTPIAANINYVTTNIATEAEFTKLPALSNLRVYRGYVVWNVAKSDILAAYNAAMSGGTATTPGEGTTPDDGSGTEPTPTPGGEGSGSEGSGGESGDSNVKTEYDDEVHSAFVSAVAGEYSNNYLTNSMYSLGYCQLVMTNDENSRVVRKVVQPDFIGNTDDGIDYVICYYFVDVEADTWHISLGAKGNTVDKEDPGSIKYIDGVMPATPLVARKLVAPLSPIHPAQPMIVDGYLTFTPVRDHNNELYTQYLVEAHGNGKVILYVHTINSADLGETSQVINVKDLGLENDILYNVSIRTYGSAYGSSGDLYLNSDTPATTALTILGRLVISVTEGQLSWAQSSADTFEFILQDLTGGEPKTTTHILPPSTTTFSLEGDEYKPGMYIATIQAIGNGSTKISSDVSVQTTFYKLGEIQSIMLSEGQFVWANDNLTTGMNGYEVTIIRTRESSTGETVKEVATTIKLPHSEESTIKLSLPEEMASYFIEENGHTSQWKYSLQIKMIGSQAGSYVTGDISEESLGYTRLNTPTNIKITRDSISWNQVSGASGYQVVISGGVSEKEIYVGSANTFTLDNTFTHGSYLIKIRALSSTSAGFITSAFTRPVQIVRTAEPNLRVERGEVMWNSVEELPFEATRFVRITINNNTLPDIENVNDNITFNFDTEEYPAGEYTVTVQFIGDGEFIVVEPDTPEGGDGSGGEEVGGEDTGEDTGSEEIVALNTDDGSKQGFYYLSSDPATISFTKLARPEIALAKETVVENEIEEEINVIVWDPIENTSVYDVFVLVEEEVVTTQDDPTTEDVDETVKTTIIKKLVFTMDENATLFGVNAEGKHYFALKELGKTYEDYKIYIRAVGDDANFVSSTSSEQIHVHIPKAPKNFKYDQSTGIISWENVTTSSNIVLEVMKMDAGGEYSIDVYPGGKELPAGTTTFQLEEIGQYQLRIKARLVISGGNNYDSDFSEEILNVNFNMFKAGSGTLLSPYQIGDDNVNNTTAEQQLNNIRYFMDRHFVLTQNIVLNTYSNWTTIGNANSPFTGVINGAGYTISNIKYTNPSYATLAFVNTLGVSSDNANAETINANASIKNLNLQISITEEYGVIVQTFAGIVATNYASINNCTIGGSVVVQTSSDANNSFGGAVNKNFGTITKVINNMNINVTRYENNTTSYSKIGGITAENYNTITQSGNNGTLTGQIVGGITADNYSVIKECYSKGSLSVITSGYGNNIIAGGITARNNNNTLGLSVNPVGTIDTCYVIIGSTSGSSITVTNNGSKEAYIGGLVGNNITTSVNLFTNNYVVFTSYTSSASTGTVKVRSLAGNTTNNKTTGTAGTGLYYEVFSNCYVHSTVNNIISYSNTNLSSETVISNKAKYNSNIVVVETLGGETINITGITCAQSNGYLPKLNWEE